MKIGNAQSVLLASIGSTLKIHMEVVLVYVLILTIDAITVKKKIFVLSADAIGCQIKMEFVLIR